MINRYKERVARIVITKTSFVSNTKWHELFLAIEECEQFHIPEKVKMIRCFY